MRDIIRFIIKYHFIFLFIILQTISVLLIVNYNSFQRSAILGSADDLLNGIYNRIENLTWYLNLRQENIALSRENNKLRNLLEKNTDYAFYQTFEEIDTIENKHYVYRTAEVINNTTNRQHNYLVINQGRKNGIKPYSAVISSNGVVGLVLDVTDNYAKVMSLLNIKFSLSAKIKKNGYFGNLHWDGGNINRVILDDIPYHVPISAGDTIVTSGYSDYFPENLTIGTINDFKLKGGNFYEIEVELSNDFRALSHVYVIENLIKDELDQLQKEDIAND